MTENEKILNYVFRYFGFYPESIGLKFEDWYFVSYYSEREKSNGVKKGYLCVRAVDPGLRDPKVTKKENFVCDIWQGTESPNKHLRYYYFRPLEYLDRLEIDTSFVITKKSLPKTIFDVRRRFGRS